MVMLLSIVEAPASGMNKKSTKADGDGNDRQQQNLVWQTQRPKKNGCSKELALRQTSEASGWRVMRFFTSL